VKNELLPKMKTKVIARGPRSESIHLFESYKEASSFAAWLMEYNSDLDLTIESTDNEINIASEHPTFI
jgi:hypothetical protein